MDQEISDVIVARLFLDPMIANSVEVVQVDDGTARLHLSLPLGVEPNNSAATSLNALALRVISMLNAASESDLWCSMSSCEMLPIQTSDEGTVVLPLKVNFTVAKGDSYGPA